MTSWVEIITLLIEKTGPFAFVFLILPVIFICVIYWRMAAENKSLVHEVMEYNKQREEKLYLLLNNKIDDMGVKIQDIHTILKK